MIAFHRFLICIAILFCLGFAAWSILAFEAQGGMATLVLGAVFLLAAAALGYYLNRLGRFLNL